MFSGRVTRSFALSVVLAQVVVSVILAAVIPAPQSMARQGSEQVNWEPSDIMLASYEPEQPALGQAEVGDAEQMELATSDGTVAGEPAVLASSGEAGGWFDSPANGAAEADKGYYSSAQLRQMGVVYDGGVRYTWYSQRVLPGGGLDIEGRHVSEEGYVVDGQERIVVASSEVPQGTELAVPFGSGRAVVLDSGCAAGTVDVYTDF